ncbi:metallophosphoesterase family protein [Companilactobacillus kimchiensis]|uniref:Phosphoesterase n=1 Tax=Companilactobacillus kimchiensis TaxID=993692 RepID=A0A0R2LMI5_9LACO|nr:YfcE family phosphodiesterase [Companilactobacillus kimchiensis]KRO00608.1 phosphoesterase-related protein [Companilactobacillus kimchiensis]
MKKVAIISDIHGNFTAFKNVIADAESQNVDEYWFLGDLLMPGPGTDSIMELLNSINTTQMIRGNWDDFLFEDILTIGRKYIQEPQTTYIVELIKYVSDHIAPKYLNQMQQWPIYSETKISGLNILLTHNYPAQNHGHELLPYKKQQNFDKLLFNKPYDIAIYGHTHHQLFRTSSNDQLVINPGSIGQPYTAWDNFNADRRAQYTIITFDDTGYGGIDFRKVAYSIDDELKFAEENNLPFFKLYKKIFTDGKAFTHNNEALNKQIEKYDYKKDVLKYLDQLARFKENSSENS